MTQPSGFNPSPRRRVFAGDGDLRGDLTSRVNPYRPFQEVMIPVHEFVTLSQAELEVLKHPAVQRLRWIQQLGLTSLVYPGATHSRLEHSLGTLAVAQQMMDVINSHQSVAPPDSYNFDWEADDPLTPSEMSFIRLAALLHDIGHLPLGHTLEDELGLFPRHDERARLDMIMTRSTWFGETGRTLGAVVDAAYASAAADAGISEPASDVILTILDSKDRDRMAARNDTALRWGVCERLVSDTVCADLMDYLHRDRHHLGMPGHFSTRLFSYMQIVRPQGGKSGGESRLVLNLQTRDRRRDDAVSEVLKLLAGRHELFEMALLHRTKVTATAMVERALAEYRDHYRHIGLDEQWREGLLDWLLEATDAEVLRFNQVPHLHGDSRGLRSVEDDQNSYVGNLPSPDPQTQEIATKLLSGVRRRSLHKPYFTRMGSQFSAGARERVIRDYGGQRGWRARLEAARGIEVGLGLKSGEVVVYCPNEISPKLAQVDVLVDEAVRPLARHEELVTEGRSTTNLTANMLAAQRARTTALWRLVVGIHPLALDRMGDGTAVLDDFLMAVFGTNPYSTKRDPVAHGLELAERVARFCPTSPLFGRQAELDESLLGALRGQHTGHRFANGLPWLTAYLPD